MSTPATIPHPSHLTFVSILAAPRPAEAAGAIPGDLLDCVEAAAERVRRLRATGLARRAT